MRIAFFDSIGWDYTIDTAWRRPLGGTQSGVCYLAAQMASMGHEVFLLNNSKEAHRSHGVTVLPIEQVFHPVEMSIMRLDVIVIVNSASNGPAVRQVVGEEVPLVLWATHADDQPSIQALKNPHYREAFDSFAFISNWQRQLYARCFGVRSDQAFTVPLAIAPRFENQFAPGESIVAAKDDPPTLAYTSAPFRGLDILVDVFPYIREKVPGLRLKVFSDMSVYTVDKHADEEQFGELYEACRSTEGIDYVGAISQPKLAEELHKVSVLAYPNVYPETGCVAAMEAMASGCWVVTTRLGALPETTGGFGRLVSLDREAEKYVDAFVHEVVAALTMNRDRPDEADILLQSQVAYTQQAHSWGPRAEEWLSKLSYVEPRQLAAIHAF